jgi:16S rRNA (guanine527-N7)-methyltransferase
VVDDEYPLNAAGRSIEDDRLWHVMDRSQELGFLGPGAVAQQIRHAEAWLPVVPPTCRVLDLGSGGGLPGLVIAWGRPDLDVTLLDAGTRRCEFLKWAVEELGLQTTVRHGRAEALALELRGCFDVVVARSFAPPPVTAECAAPFLRHHGILIVSDRMLDDAGVELRWPEAGLAQLGMRRGERHLGDGTALLVLHQDEECPERFPRRDGVAAKRPLFHVEQSPE